MNRMLSGFCAAIALTFSSATPLVAQDHGAHDPAQAQKTKTGPALWKVADEDTTVYLFGTIHILPRNIEWFGGDIETALASSDILITEIPADVANDSAVNAAVMQKAMLGDERTLRGLLNADQRKVYEGGMRHIGLPTEAFDDFEPWFAGITLSMMPLIQAGYDPNSGVEEVLEAIAPASIDRGALETAQEQLDMLDNLPMSSQVAWLLEAAKDPDRTVAQVDEMVNFWVAGDPDSLAVSMSEGLSDPVVAKVLLYDRNERWADWIKTRMKRPGTVFIAVGAGHLAGEKSVQDFLAQRELAVTRIQ